MPHRNATSKYSKESNKDIETVQNRYAGLKEDKEDNLQMKEGNGNMINEPKQKDRETSKTTSAKEITNIECNIKKTNKDSIIECIRKISSDKGCSKVLEETLDNSKLTHITKQMSLEDVAKHLD